MPENDKGILAALLAVQKETPSLKKTAVNPQRDRHRNPLSDCPDCGNPKLKRAQRCRSCANKAKTGLRRTDDPSLSTGWRRARELRPLTECEFEGCDSIGRDRHHIDGDPLNNIVENIAVYCRRHHMEVDGRLAALKERAQRAGQFGGRPKGIRNGR